MQPGSPPFAYIEYFFYFLLHDTKRNHPFKLKGGIIRHIFKHTRHLIYSPFIDKAFSYGVFVPVNLPGHRTTEDDRILGFKDIGYISVYKLHSDHIKERRIGICTFFLKRVCRILRHKNECFTIVPGTTFHFRKVIIQSFC